MLNSGAAVTAALLPYPVMNVTGEPAVGTSLSASAAGSFASNDRALAAYEWSVIAVSGSTPQLLSPTQAQTLITITGAGQFTLRLTVTDDHGAQASKAIEIHTPVTTVAATTQTPSSGGGGGAFGWELLVIALTAAVRRADRRAS
jgi:hypothetical protein